MDAKNAFLVAGRHAPRESVVLHRGISLSDAIAVLGHGLKLKHQDDIFMTTLPTLQGITSIMSRDRCKTGQDRQRNVAETDAVQQLLPPRHHAACGQVNDGFSLGTTPMGLTVQIMNKTSV
jgi:hypothetical protein